MWSRRGHKFDKSFFIEFTEKNYFLNKKIFAPFLPQNDIPKRGGETRIWGDLKKWSNLGGGIMNKFEDPWFKFGAGEVFLFQNFSNQKSIIKRPIRVINLKFKKIFIKNYNYDFRQRTTLYFFLFYFWVIKSLNKNRT